MKYSRGIVLAVLAVYGSVALGWWDDGHRKITAGAMSHLPPVLKAYVYSRGSHLPVHSGVEPPGKHYIDIDAYAEFNPYDPTAMPRNLNTLIALYGYEWVEWKGMGPWTIEDYVDQLTLEMATAATDDDWYDLLATAAELAHYIEDHHNPLHLTENYNGQLTGNDGVHAHYEGYMVDGYHSLLTIAPAPNACVYLPSPIDTIFDGIHVHYLFVDDIMAGRHREQSHFAELRPAYYASMWQATGAFTQDLFQEASEVVASAWYTAWVDAGAPDPIYPGGDGDFDEDGDRDLTDYARMQLCLGYISDPLCAAGDFDADNKVDAIDLAAFSSLTRGPQ